MQVYEYSSRARYHDRQSAQVRIGDGMICIHSAALWLAAAEARCLACLASRSRACDSVFAAAASHCTCTEHIIPE